MQNKSSPKSQSMNMNMNMISVNDTKIPPIGHQKSVSLMGPSQLRKDIFGKEIRKGGKVHKISFIDKKEGNERKKQYEVAEVVLIDNYKEYNKTMCYPEMPFSMAIETPCCKTCIII